MKCDQSLKPLTALATCTDIMLNVHPLVTGVITDIARRREGWQIEGLTDNREWCAFYTSESPGLVQGMRFELIGDIMKILADEQ